MASNKAQKTTYWILTVLIAAMNLMAAFGLLMRWPQNMEGLTHLGYPIYFATILGVAKLLGSISLVYTRFRTLTEWAYAGFTFLFLSAAYSHFVMGDGAAKALAPFIMLALLLVSYKLWKKGAR